MHEFTLPPIESYVVRDGPFEGRRLCALNKEEMHRMIDDIPKDSDAECGKKLMHFIVENHGPHELINFIAWGQHIVDTTGSIDKIDFIPDADEPPQTPEEKKMLGREVCGRPTVTTSRRVFLSLVPSAAISAAGFARYAARLADEKASPEAEEPAPAAQPKGSASPKDNEQANAPPNRRSALKRIGNAVGEAADWFFDYPAGVLGGIIFLNELMDLVDDYEPKQFEEITHAVTEIADTMGIGAPTSTYRLPPRSSGR